MLNKMKSSGGKLIYISFRPNLCFCDSVNRWQFQVLSLACFCFVFPICHARTSDIKCGKKLRHRMADYAANYAGFFSLFVAVILGSV